MYQALAEILDQLPQTAEIIFADDGSTDGSAAALDAFAEGDRRVRVLHLSRNYGQTSALMAAMSAVARSNNAKAGIIISFAPFEALESAGAP